MRLTRRRVNKLGPGASPLLLAGPRGPGCPGRSLGLPKGVSKALWAILQDVRSRGLLEHTPGSLSHPPNPISFLPGNIASSPCCLLQKVLGESGDHRCHGGPRPRSLGGQEGDLGVGNRGQGEGRGGISPQDPEQQLLLLLLELSP